MPGCVNWTDFSCRSDSVPRSKRLVFERRRHCGKKGSPFGKSTMVPVVTANRCGTNVSLCWFITARAGSVRVRTRARERLPAHDRFQTIDKVALAGVPRSDTVGRRSLDGRTWRISTRPWMVPRLAPAKPRDAPDQNRHETGGRGERRQHPGSPPDAAASTGEPAQRQNQKTT